MELSWEQLNAIEQEYGDSYFLIDLDVFRRNFHDLRDAFRAHYPKTELAYSYKTNYMPRLCRLVNRWGGYAEVVSRMEYEMALRAGVEPRRIVFNGPCRTRSDLEDALRAGARVNVDSPYQIRALEAMGDSDHVFELGVRCNFDVTGDRVSRFGFDAEGTELAETIDRLRALPPVDVVGLHCHFSLPGRRPECYESVARRMVELARRFFGSDPPRYIDIGGGYFGRMPRELAAQFGGEVPSFADYADAVGPVLATAYPEDGSERPELILEPGVSVTADTGVLVTRVLDVHTLRGRRFAQVSTSVQVIKPTMNPLNLPVRVVPGPDSGSPRPNGPVDVVGYTCMERDVLFHGLEGDVAPGDYLVFENCGAYTNVQKMPFIRSAPAMLTLNPAGGVEEVLRRAETTDDILSTYSS